MRDELNNLFSKTEPTRIVATVFARLSTGGYQVRNRSGRQFAALAGATYSPGDEVLVESGRISGRAQTKPLKRYEV